MTGLTPLTSATPADPMAAWVSLRARAAGSHGHPGLRENLRVALHLVPRLATSPWRALPDFLILGAARCGTTSLYADLREHPNVVRALRKEVLFLDHTFNRGAWWYRAFFPLRSQLLSSPMSGGAPAITGEATPCYLFHPHGPERAARTVPNARFIVLLRDPVDRAHSFYRQQVRFGLEPLSFEEALDAEEGRLRGEGERMEANPQYVSVARQNYSYRARGRYAEQLEAWFRVLPREQFLVVFSEDLWADRPQEFSRVTDFLGLPRWQPARPARLKVFPPSPMAEATRLRLRRDFAPDDERLSELLDRELPWRA